MPMNPAGLGADIASALTGLSEAEKQDVNVIWTKVATLIITHIISNATIITPVQGAPTPGTIT